MERTMRAIVFAMIGALGLLLAVSAGPATAQDGYRIGPGDQLTIEVLQDSSLNRTVVVLPDGRFSFPFAGSVTAAGRTVGQVEAAVTAAIASNFATEPNVFVSVQPAPEEPRVRTAPSAPAAPPTISVYYLGEVQSPGLRDIAPGTTILQALAQTGGFTDFAALKRIQVRRTNRMTGVQQVVEINYQALSEGARMTNDFTLQEGDVILVPQRRLFE